jgi:crotonobetainyl-CoA:carnitine CoA-transferase CaiB-like acyl-CoA transferase
MSTEVREIDIKSRADAMGVRPWPANPPPSKEDVAKIYEKRKAGEFGKYIEDILGFEHVSGKPETLQGYRVIDIGIWRMSNSFASSLLAEAGAEVIKVEPPGGDPLRNLTPFGRDEYMLESQLTGEKTGMDFIAECRNKYCITLDLETTEGQALFLRLVEQSDVLIENWPPGYLDELGIGYRQLIKINPRLIYCYIGVRGQWGALKDTTSKHGQWMLDPFGQAACPFIHHTGYPQDFLPRQSWTGPGQRDYQGGGDPTKSGVWTSDYTAGEQAATNILAALWYREEVSGKGQMVEVSGAEAQMDILDFDLAWYGFNASIKSRTGGWDPNLNQYEWNPCKDGYMMIGGQSDRLWYRIGQCIERDLPMFGRLIHEDPFLKEMGARNALQALVKTYTLTTMWLRNITRVESEEKLLEYEIAAGPLLYMDEVAEFPHFVYRRWVDLIEDEHYGLMMYAVSPQSYQHRTPWRVKWLGRPIGYDNGEIYSRVLGVGPERQRDLKEKGVI